MRSDRGYSRAGFTLVEISIVLVIIALMSGGIMAGRYLMKVAELNSIHRQLIQYEAARNTFEAKYNCLAGDCRNAAESGLGANGNGNGYLDVFGYGNELYQYWLQLSNANLIKGKFTGLPGPLAPYDYVIGSNIPATARGEVGIGVLQLIPQPEYYVWAKRFGAEEKITTHFYTVGKDTGNFGNWGGALSVAELRGLDIKYDDGLANNGRIRTHIGWAGVLDTRGCTVPSATSVADVDATSEFNYSASDATICNMLYLFWP